MNHHPIDPALEALRATIINAAFACLKDGEAATDSAIAQRASVTATDIVSSFESRLHLGAAAHRVACDRLAQHLRWSDDPDTRAQWDTWLKENPGMAELLRRFGTLEPDQVYASPPHPTEDWLTDAPPVPEPAPPEEITQPRGRWRLTGDYAVLRMDLDQMEPVGRARHFELDLNAAP